MLVSFLWSANVGMRSGFVRHRSGVDEPVPAHQARAPPWREIDSRWIRMDRRDEARVHQSKPERREIGDGEHAEVAVGQLRQVVEDCVRVAVLADQTRVTAPQAIHATLAANPKTPLESGSQAAQLKALRAFDKKRFTQARLASLFGLSQSWVSDLLRSNT